MHWNSQLKMIRKVRLVSPQTMQKLDYAGKLSPYENKILDELTDILTLLETATNFPQAQNQVTSSIVLSCIQGLWTELAELQKKYNCQLVRTLAAMVDMCQGKHDSIDLFTLSAALTPTLVANLGYFHGNCQHPPDLGGQSCCPPPRHHC